MATAQQDWGSSPGAWDLALPLLWPCPSAQLPLGFSVLSFLDVGGQGGGDLWVMGAVGSAGAAVRVSLHFVTGVSSETGS